MPEWSKDLQAMLRGWQVLIRGKLYYDQKSGQYYDGNMQRMTYEEVANRHRFDPMKPQEIYAQTAQPSPRTQQITGWQPAGGLPTGVPTVTEGEGEQAELERLATQMGISVQELLRAQYGIPQEEEPQEGLTEYQQAQLDLQKQQSWWGLQQQREATRGAAYGWGQQRYAHQLQTGGGDIRQAQQAGQASLWEDWQNRLASGATWPQSEILRTQENPYEVTPESIGDELQSVKAEWEFAKEKADWFRKRQKDPDDPLTQGYYDIQGDPTDFTPDQQAAYGAFLAEAVAFRQYEQSMTSPEAQDWAGWKARQESTREVSRKAGWGADYGRDLPPKLPPPMPKTPAFLREVYPELGERLPRDKGQAPMGVLSGQQWGQMSPSQRGKWGGYIGWAGGKPEDLYAQMQKMTPQYRRGVSWRPARQRA